MFLSGFFTMALTVVLSVIAIVVPTMAWSGQGSKHRGQIWVYCSLVVQFMACKFDYCLCLYAVEHVV